MITVMKPDDPGLGDRPESRTMPHEGISQPALARPAAVDADWADKIQIAKSAREHGSRLREGKSVAADSSLAPYYSG
jgi:hypothetical protein